MKPPLLKLLGIVCLGLILSSWGFYAHRKINYYAVFSLPAEMLPFFKKQISYLEEHATDPDKRRYILEGEDVKHFFDADHWSEDPFSIFPLPWDSACSIYGEDSLRSYGVLPWNLQWSYYKLVRAMDSNQAHLVLKYAADLGHYIADACVPLHTTENYNGQLSHQHGIHAFWETRLPEMYLHTYDLRVGRADYIMDTQEYFWDLIQESFAAKDSVLSFEKFVRQGLNEVEQYTITERGKSQVHLQSEKFAKRYHKILNGMVERRFRKSIKAVADIWYTAWVDAGQPDMYRLDSLQVASESNRIKRWLQESERLIGRGRGH